MYIPRIRRFSAARTGYNTYGGSKVLATRGTGGGGATTNMLEPNKQKLQVAARTRRCVAQVVVETCRWGCGSSPSDASEARSRFVSTAEPAFVVPELIKSDDNSQGHQPLLQLPLSRARKMQPAASFVDGMLLLHKSNDRMATRETDVHTRDEGAWSFGTATGEEAGQRRTRIKRQTIRAAGMELVRAVTRRVWCALSYQ